MSGELRGFNRGFLPGLEKAAGILADGFIDRRKKKDTEAKEQAEKEKREAEQLKIDSTINRLLDNGRFVSKTVDSYTTNPPDYFKSSELRGYVPENKRTPFEKFGNTYRAEKTSQQFFEPDSNEIQNQLKRSLSPKDLNYYQDLKREQAPIKPPELKYKEDEPFLYYEDPDTGEPKLTDKKNPFYELKPIRSVTDYNNKGEKVIREFYRDGSSKDIPTGFYKKNDEEGFDFKKFNTTLDKYTKEDVRLNGLKAKYDDPYDLDNKEALKYEINASNEANERTLFDLVDDKMKDYIKVFYTELKEVAKKHGKDFTLIEREKQEELKKKFQERVKLDWSGSSEDYTRRRAALLWSKFKYSYIND